MERRRPEPRVRTFPDLHCPDGTSLAAEVERLATDILNDIDRDGWSNGNPIHVESPGLMTGLSGIGYQLLRLAEPARIPSVLTLTSLTSQW
jgi:lantibiotic modifying enzyme